MSSTSSDDLDDGSAAESYHGSDVGDEMFEGDIAAPVEMGRPWVSSVGMRAWGEQHQLQRFDLMGDGRWMNVISADLDEVRTRVYFDVPPRPVGVHIGECVRIMPSFVSDGGCKLLRRGTTEPIELDAGITIEAYHGDIFMIKGFRGNDWDFAYKVSMDQTHDRRLRPELLTYAGMARRLDLICRIDPVFRGRIVTGHVQRQELRERVAESEGMHLRELRVFENQFPGAKELWDLKLGWLRGVVPTWRIPDQWDSDSEGFSPLWD